MGSSQTRAQTHVPCIGRRILNHCATREALVYFKNYLRPKIMHYRYFTQYNNILFAWMYENSEILHKNLKIRVINLKPIFKQIVYFLTFLMYFKLYRYSTHSEAPLPWPSWPYLLRLFPLLILLQLPWPSCYSLNTHTHSRLRAFAQAIPLPIALFPHISLWLLLWILQASAQIQPLTRRVSCSSAQPYTSPLGVNTAASLLTSRSWQFLLWPP